ncbi:MAG: IS200/IS605 family transposase [Halothece sp.]
MSTLNTSSHSAYQLQYHIIFTVKYRKKMITKAMLTRLEEIFSDVCRKWRCRLVEFGGEVDHVHLLVNAPSSYGFVSFCWKLENCFF